MAFSAPAKALADVGFAGRHLHQHDQAGGAFHQRANGAGPARTEDEVALPMARHQAACDVLRPVADVGHAAEFAAPLRALWLAAPAGLGLPQIREQLPAQRTTRQGVERGVDCLVRHPQARRLLHPRLDPLSPTRNLLRRPAEAQQSGDLSEQRTIHRQPRLAVGQSPAGGGLCLSRLRPVARRAAMPLQFSRDRAR